MSIKEAIYELADAAGSDAPHNGTKLDALDALTDALSDGNQPRCRSVEDAVIALEPYVNGGGGGGWTPGSSVVPIYGDMEDAFSYFAATDPDIEHVICSGVISSEGVGLADGVYFAIFAGMHAVLYLCELGEHVGRVDKLGQVEYDGDPYDVYLIPELQEGVDNIEVAPDHNLFLDNSTELTVKYKAGTDPSEKTFPNFESAGTTVTVKIVADADSIVVSYTPEGGSKTVIEYGMDIGWRFTMPDAATTVTVEAAGALS